MNLPQSQQAQQKRERSAVRSTYIVAANVFSAASVWAAYLGATQNPRAYLLALGLAAGATLLFRWQRRQIEAETPLFTLILPLLMGGFVLWGMANASEGKPIAPPAWTGTSVLIFVLALDFWFQRKGAVKTAKTANEDGPS